MIKKLLGLLRNRNFLLNVGVGGIGFFLLLNLVLNISFPVFSRPILLFLFLLLLTIRLFPLFGLLFKKLTESPKGPPKPEVKLTKRRTTGSRLQAIILLAGAGVSLLLHRFLGGYVVTYHPLFKSYPPFLIIALFLLLGSVWVVSSPAQGYHHLHFVARNGRLFFLTAGGEEEEVTLENWKQYKRKLRQVKPPPKDPERRYRPARVAWLTVWADTAVVLDIQARRPRVCLAGHRDIRGSEDLRAIIDLRTQVRVAAGYNAVRVLTQDGIPLRIGVEVSFQIARDNSLLSEGNPYPAIEEAIKRAAYRTTVLPGGAVSAWDSAPLALVSGQLRDVVERYSFDKLYSDELEGDKVPRQIIASELTPPWLVKDLADDGIQLNAASLLDFELDADADQDIIQRWKDRRTKALEQEWALSDAMMQAEAAVELLDPVASTVAHPVSFVASMEPTVVIGDQVQFESLHLIYQELQKVSQRVERVLAQRDIDDRQELLDILWETQRRQDQLQAEIGRVYRRAEGAGEVVAEKEVLLEEALIGAIEVLDTLDRGVTTINPAILHNRPVASAYARSLIMIQQQMVALFVDLGLEEVPGEGEAFDAAVHRVVGRDPASPLPPGHVSRVEQRGYFYRGKLLRSAQVWVSGRDDSSDTDAAFAGASS